jgi:hypothetical protein
MSTQPPPLTPPVDEAVGPIPENNLPGHHPEHEQDKPEVPPAQRPRRKRADASAKKPKSFSPATQTSAPAAPSTEASASVPLPALRRFAFAIDPTMAPIARLFGVTAGSAWVEVSEDELVAKFGPWVLCTPRANVAGAQVSGPYAWAKVVGGPRMSLADRGLTFATTTRGGVCIRFEEPVGGVLPVPFLRHPGLTVTPDDPEGLVDALSSASPSGEWS